MTQTTDTRPETAVTDTPEVRESLAETGSVADTPGGTVYDRCGGYAGMLRIATSILELHHANAILDRRYSHAVKSDGELARLVAELLSSVTGGSETYTGMTMLQAHTGMNVSNDEFVEVLDDILKALEVNGVSKADQDTILGLNYGLKPDVVGN